jgi:hypothetical protein
MRACLRRPRNNLYRRTYSLLFRASSVRFLRKPCSFRSRRLHIPKSDITLTAHRRRTARESRDILRCPRNPALPENSGGANCEREECLYARRDQGMAQPMLCTQCGMVTTPRRVTPGSVWITFVLCCCIVVPGLIYSIWRHTSTYVVCSQCGSRSVIPPGSPLAQDMIATRPSVAASLAVENQRRRDTGTGAKVVVGIIVLLVLLINIKSCGH